MQRISLKYHCLHIFYWIATCCIMGYIAVYLQYKGLNNTLIGIATGGGCMSTIVLSPLVTHYATKYNRLTIHQFLAIIFGIIFLFFIGTEWIKSQIILIIFYIFMIALINSTIPFLSTLAMNFVQDGYAINFGLSRGLGSLSYAVTALLLGSLIKQWNPSVLIYVYFISMAIVIGILHSLPPCYIHSQQDQQVTENHFEIIKKYHNFFIILLGFVCINVASQPLSTYLINIVTQLGGQVEIYGVAVFFMAASELPIMAMTTQLMKKITCDQLLVMTAFFYLLRHIVICQATSLPILFLGMLLNGLAYGLFTTVIVYYVTLHLARNDQMMGQTLVGVMTSGLGATLGNYLGGSLLDHYSMNVFYQYVYAMSIVGFLLIVGVYLKQRSERNDS